MENGNGKDKILARLKKVLALAQSPNENEAARAMEKVQEILAEHNLSIADLEDKPVVEINAGTRLEEAYPYRRVLASSVAQLYFCTYYYEVHRKVTASGGYNMDKHMFVGAPHNTGVARSMFDYLFKTVDRLSKEAADENANGGSKWSYMTSFRVACSQRLCARIAKRIAEAKAGTAKASGGGTLPALASLYNQAQVVNSDFMNQAIPEMKQTKTRTTVSDIFGAMAGIAAAEGISLDAQVGAGKRAARLR